MGLWGLSSYSDRMRERKVLTFFRFLHPQPPNLIYTPAGARVPSGLHLPPHTARWPPLLLCAPRQCSTTSDNLPSGLPRPPPAQTPRDGVANPGPSRCRSMCVRACACVGACACAYVGGGTPAGVLLPALSLFYLINVIYSWNSVRVGKEPSPDPAVLTAQPPPPLAFRPHPAAPVSPHSPSGQLRPEGKTQVPVCVFFYLACPGISHLLCRR